jgi:peptidoglycan hydrolase-like protein with peptidoglycan-binding domain
MTFLSKPIEKQSQEMSPCNSVFERIRAAGGIAAAAGSPGGVSGTAQAAAKKPDAEQPADANNGTAPKPNATAAAAPQRDKITRIQQALRKANVSVKVDGVLGPETKAALRRFQAQHGLAQTGIPDRATVLALGLTAGDAVQPSRQPAQRGG